MEGTPWILVAVIGVLALLALAVLMLKRRRGEESEPDYRAFFAIGISWLAIGIATEKMGLTGVGVVFMVLGLTHRDEWNEPAPMTPNRRRLMYVLVGATVLAVILTAGYLLKGQ